MVLLCPLTELPAYCHALFRHFVINEWVDYSTEKPVVRLSYAVFSDMSLFCKRYTNLLQLNQWSAAFCRATASPHSLPRSVTEISPLL
jgi:hypothetical protein